MSSGNILGLYIPKQRIADADAPYLRPKDVDKWVRELPLAHIGESSRLIFKALVESNRVDMPTPQRLKLLEQLRTPVALTVDALTRHYVGQPFPISVKNQKVAELAQELNWEMAIGYKIVLNSAMSGFAQRLDNKSLALTIHRAIFYLSHAIIKTYEVYKAPPERAWLEIHHLYLFSEHNRMHQEPVKDSLQKDSATVTIVDTYKQILLLAAANPFRLPQKEVEKVYSLLRAWVKHTELRPIDVYDTTAGLFIINLEKDAPPNYFDGAVDKEAKLYLRLLDTTSLSRVLRDQLDSINREVDKNDQAIAYLENRLHRDTLRRLLLVWGAVPRRNFSRQGKNVTVDICLGLNATHFYIDKFLAEKNVGGLAAKSQRNAMEKSGYQPKAKFITNEEADNLFVPWDKPELSPLLKSPFPDENEVQFEDKGNDVYEQYSCLLVNESAGGFCLNWQNSSITKTMVGSLVGIRSPDKDRGGTITVGVIRWLRSDAQPQLHFGVEILAPYAQPVAIKNLSRKSDMSPFMRGLLLPEIRAVNQSQTLVTPPLFRVGDRLRVDIAGQSVKVKLTKLLESTTTFSQFQFHVLKNAEIVAETDKMDRIKNFDALWTAI